MQHFLLSVVIVSLKLIGYELFIRTEFAIICFITITEICCHTFVVNCFVVFFIFFSGMYYTSFRDMHIYIYMYLYMYIFSTHTIYAYIYICTHMSWGNVPWLAVIFEVQGWFGPEIWPRFQSSAFSAVSWILSRCKVGMNCWVCDGDNFI